MNKKLEQILKEKEKLYVVIDFDKTITAFESADSWDASGKTLEENFLKEMNDLYQKYRPIEKDYTITLEEKTKAMQEWYEGCMNLYYKYKLTQEKLEKSIQQSNLIFRKGAKEFLKNLNKNKVPVIILSAGIGNVIKQFLAKNNCGFENIHIISNFIEFDENGDMKKFDNSKIIHTLNKTLENHLPKEWQQKIEQKEWALLFGDLIEDLNMLPKNQKEKAVTVGFLEECEQRSLEKYKNNFDIVLVGREAEFSKFNQKQL